MRPSPGNAFSYRTWFVLYASAYSAQNDVETFRAASPIAKR
jgi:hypothetical protein